jgi:hypothetical protein
MIEVNVTSDIKEMQRDLWKVRSRIPSLTAQAVNALATWARRETISETASKLHVRESLISRIIRRTRSGGKETAPRFVLTRAKPFIPVAYLNVNGKAIELSDVPYYWSSTGVSGPGGRFSRSAFVAKIAGKKRVLKRKGKARLPLRSPYIFTRKSMEDTFKRHISGPAGNAYFRNKFRELGANALQKAGIR